MKPRRRKDDDSDAARIGAIARHCGMSVSDAEAYLAAVDIISGTRLPWRALTSVIPREGRMKPSDVVKRVPGYRHQKLKRPIHVVGEKYRHHE